MEMRLLLAFLLMGLGPVRHAVPLKGANQPAPKGPQNINPQKAAEMTKAPEPAPASPVAPPTAARRATESSEPAQADKEERLYCSDTPILPGGVLQPRRVRALMDFQEVQGAERKTNW